MNSNFHFHFHFHYCLWNSHTHSHSCLNHPYPSKERKKKFFMSCINEVTGTFHSFMEMFHVLRSTSRNSFLYVVFLFSEMFQHFSFPCIFVIFYLFSFKFISTPFTLHYLPCHSTFFSLVSGLEVKLCSYLIPQRDIFLPNLSSFLSTCFRPFFMFWRKPGGEEDASFF